MRITEQVDSGKNGPIYSWIIDGLPKHYQVQMPGWRWIKGVGCKGCFVTNDPIMVRPFLHAENVTIESNGTHAIHNAPMATF